MTSPRFSRRWPTRSAPGRRPHARPPTRAPARRKRRTALIQTELGAFSIHAGTSVAAGDRAGLERLLRYAGPGPAGTHIMAAPRPLARLGPLPATRAPLAFAPHSSYALGHPLPNTYYPKSGGSAGHWRLGVGYVEGHTWLHLGILGFIGSVVAIVGLARGGYALPPDEPLASEQG